MNQRLAFNHVSPDLIGPRREAETLHRLIGRIYDAALEPALWSDVIEHVGDFVGDQAAALLRKESVDRNIESRDDIDTRVIQLRAMPSRPQGWVEAAHALLERSAAGCSEIATPSHASLADDDTMCRRMALVMPHLRRALGIAQAIELKRAEAATFVDALDGVGAGLFLVGADGRLIHVNAAGRAILDADDFLRTIGGRLVARDAHASQHLRDVIATDGGAAPDRKGISLMLTDRDGERHVAHVLPLTTGARRRAGIAYAATAAVFVRKVAMATPAHPDVIATACSLTPAELRVLLAIVDIGGVPEVAVRLGIAETTVKTHLGRVFEKTGTGRQADLVKLVAGFASPLAG
jgi:DNA-binding CsgD family transcriptional regulator/PAS domain-containing protein